MMLIKTLFNALYGALLSAAVLSFVVMPGLCAAEATGGEQTLQHELREILFDQHMEFDEKVAALATSRDEAISLMREVLHEKGWPQLFAELFLEISEQEAVAAMSEYLDTRRVTSNNDLRIRRIVEALGKYPSDETTAVLQSFLDPSGLNIAIEAAGLLCITGSERTAYGAAQWLEIFHEPALRRLSQYYAYTVASALARASAYDRLTETAIKWLLPPAPTNVPERALAGFADAMAAGRLSDSQKARVFDGICEAMEAFLREDPHWTSFHFNAVQLALAHEDTSEEVLSRMVNALVELYKAYEHLLTHNQERGYEDEYPLAICNEIMEHRALLEQRLKKLQQ